MSNYLSKNAWYKPKSVNGKLLLTILVLLVIQVISYIPVPFINHDYLEASFSNSSNVYSLIDLFSGNSFNNMTLLALGIVPYITASIILQLLGIIFPKIAEIPKEGMVGKRKWQFIQICTGVGLGFLQAIGLALNLKHAGVLSSTSFGAMFLISLCWTIGCGIVIAAGEYINKFGIGNGISLILAFNIISTLPNDIMNFYFIYIKLLGSNSIWYAIRAVAIFVAVFIAWTMCIIELNGGEKKIPLVYAKKTTYSRHVNSILPIKFNISGVMPVIFTSTILSVPAMFLSFSDNKFAVGFTKFISSTYWFKKDEWWWSFGILLYFVLVVGFAYYYKSISFKENEIANHLKKNGGSIPGIRPGTATADYLRQETKYITLYSAICLFLLTQVPNVISHFTYVSSLSFGGTSMLIVVGVLLETAQAIKAEAYYTGFNKDKKKSFLGMSTNSYNGGFLG